MIAQHGASGTVVQAPTVDKFNYLTKVRQMDDELQTIRAFNRTVAQCLGMLNQQYLGRDRPYVESRVLFEIGVEV